jgi:hypothetical protein
MKMAEVQEVDADDFGKFINALLNECDSFESSVSRA